MQTEPNVWIAICSMNNTNNKSVHFHMQSTAIQKADKCEHLIK